MSTNNMDRFEFRCIRPEETQQAIEIEQICFPPNEACSPKSLTERIKATAETFLVAEDKETGKLAAFLNGVPTDEEAFRDEFFTDISLSNPEGKNIMLLGLDVRPESEGLEVAADNFVAGGLASAPGSRRRHNRTSCPGRRRRPPGRWCPGRCRGSGRRCWR